MSSQKFDSFERTFPSCGSDPTPRTIQFSLKRRPKPQALFAQLMTNSLYNMKFIWVSLSISLCLILTVTILVAAGRVHSISKDSVLMARGPVPPSSASSCTYIGGDDGADHSPCLTTPTNPPWGWWWSSAFYDMLYFQITEKLWYPEQLVLDFVLVIDFSFFVLAFSFIFLFLFQSYETCKRLALCD